MSRYVKCDARDIPARVTWITPRRFAGQIIETSFACFSRKCDHDDGCTYRSITDHSDSPRATTYYRLAQESGAS